MTSKTGRGRGEAPSDKNELRGLPSLTEARRRNKGSWLPPKFWAWSAVILGASLIFWWKREEGKIQEMRAELLARQRAAVAELGPRWFPLRDKIEGWTKECATVADEVVDADALRGWDFRTKPGIYLRLAQPDAETPERIRAAARRSLHDGFTACLVTAANPNPLAGPACTSNKDCPPRQQCNEFDHCAPYAQPYNLRLAYRVMWLLTDDWVDEVNAITTELTMRGAVASFDSWNQYDITVAADLLTRAKYFMVVVDEPLEGEPAPSGDSAPVDDPAWRLAEKKSEVFRGGRADEMGINESIPTKPHKARVCAWRIEDGRQVLAVRRDAAGRMLGPASGVDAEVLKSRQRQANSCALAMEVRTAIGDNTPTELPE
ncbi:MAG: hypothetical protein JRI23_20280 [Deltaproteobacteria bacterium]|nr:hypothetical protein [Deltaproteobacteria bacterium]MBW2534224.1 hypothetical protein [Deltaproteobacteria bacterium]